MPPFQNAVGLWVYDSNHSILKGFNIPDRCRICYGEKETPASTYGLWTSRLDVHPR